MILNNVINATVVAWAGFGALVLIAKAVTDSTHEFRPKISKDFILSGLKVWVALLIVKALIYIGSL